VTGGKHPLRYSTFKKKQNRGLWFRGLTGAGPLELTFLELNFLKLKLLELFVLVSILSKLLFALVGRDFSELTLSSAGHFNLSFLPMEQRSGLSMDQGQKNVKRPD
jgi:hypothetical protein